MTHARTPPKHDRDPERPSFEGLPELDDVLRGLSTLLELPLVCRRRACRATRRCQGGEIPLCFHENRRYVAESITVGLKDIRRFWERQRAVARQQQNRRPGSPGGDFGA